MKFFIKTTLLLGVISLSFVGCKKPGCVDGDATNYNEKAKTDDGSCVYEGTVLFWYGEDAAEEMVDDDADILTFYIDGKSIGSTEANLFWGSQPECGGSGTITSVRNLGNSLSYSGTYKVVDQDGFVHYQGVADFKANTCQAIELK